MKRSDALRAITEQMRSPFPGDEVRWHHEFPSSAHLGRFGSEAAMGRIWTSELGEHVGERVRLAGWLHHQRTLAHISFLLLRDRAGIAQLVLTDRGHREAVAAFLPETVLEVQGLVVANEQAPAGVEVQEPEVVVVAEPEAPPPFELRRDEIPAHLPTLLDHAPV